MPLTEYINLHFSGNKSEFARHMGVTRQAVNKWIDGGWIIENKKLYSPQRNVPEREC